MARNEAAEQSHDLLWQSEEPFATLVSSVEDYAIILLNPEGNIISWNTGAQRITGYEPEEIIGKHFLVFYTQEELSVTRQDMDFVPPRRRGSAELRPGESKKTYPDFGEAWSSRR
jgi:PAS domain S-box-containing protein